VQHQAALFSLADKDLKAVQHLAKTLTENGVATDSKQIDERNRCEVEAWVACTVRDFGGK
jgi:hypothetical protein